MKRIHCMLAAMLLWVFIACNDHKDKELMASAKNIAVQENELECAAAILSADTVAAPANNTYKQHQVPDKTDTRDDWDKKIIKTGNLTLEVKQYAAFNELVHTTVKQLGGYVAQEQQNQSEYKIENAVVVKVPVDQFDNAMALLSPSGEKVMEKKITSEDVTAALVDTRSRMEAKKKVRDRYLDFLKQAKNMEEVLKVQDEINGIQETIEAGAGRINYLGHAAAFSTIHLDYYQVLTAAPVADPPPSYGIRVLQSFKTGLHWFAEFFITLVTVWPLWLALTMAWFFIKRIKLSTAKKV